MRYTCLALLLSAGACHAQTSQSPATARELQYLRFMLLNVASLDHGPDAIRAFEDSLLKQFGLSFGESSVIHSAGRTLNGLLAQHR